MSSTLKMMKTVTVPAMASTLATLGVPPPDSLVTIALIPAGDVYWEKDAVASGASLQKVPSAGEEFPCNTKEAGKLSFYANNVQMTVQYFTEE